MTALRSGHWTSSPAAAASARVSTRCAEHRFLRLKSRPVAMHAMLAMFGPVPSHSAWLCLMSGPDPSTLHRGFAPYVPA